MKKQAREKVWEVGVGDRYDQSCLHILKNIQSWSESCGLLENNHSFCFLYWVTCKRHSCSLFPKYCEAVGFCGWKLKVPDLQQSRGHSKVKASLHWSAVPTKNAGSQGQLPTWYIFWKIKEMRIIFLNHESSSFMEEERGRNGSFKTVLIMLDPWNHSQKHLATPRAWVSVKYRGL